MNIFSVNGNLSIDTSNVYVNGVKADLSVCTLSYDEYAKLVKDGECSHDTLYIVSSNYINAYGQSIKNIAEPELSCDAATKAYVDAQVSSCSQTLTRDEVAQIAKDVFKNGIQSILSTL